MNKQLTCEERVDAHFESRMDDLKQLWAAYCDPDNEDDHVEDLGNIFEYGLAFDYVAPGTFQDQDEGYWRYQISTGGPGEEFRFFSSMHNTKPYKIQFWFLDWFDGAHRNPVGSDLELLIEIWWWFSECGSTEQAQKEEME